MVGMEMFIEGGPGSDGVTEWSEKGGLCRLEKSGNEKVRMAMKRCRPHSSSVCVVGEGGGWGKQSVRRVGELRGVCFTEMAKF